MSSEHSLIRDHFESRLLAKKSSYQAWKCVSFGCSLLAIVLLFSKWHEISSDLRLLINIERLIWLNTSNNNHQLNATAANDSSSFAADSSSGMSWPPVPLEELLPAANESHHFGLESLESNSSMLMSHMHINLNRELNGNQLLKHEIETFIAEFRGAKSTISLSSLLVSVYIISWILMTLAINDARISNDISLRNILLLSVFGAIDLAASAGFVLVRLIMYSVKNNSFQSEILNSAGLKETPVRLTGDQLTAFTALRLIAMRSCSAYMDIYVSVIVSLLTILRLYAIVQALAYYRQLRRWRNSSSSSSQQQPDDGEFNSFGASNAASRWLSIGGGGLNMLAFNSKQQQQIWPNQESFVSAPAGMISQTTPPPPPMSPKMHLQHQVAPQRYAFQTGGEPSEHQQQQMMARQAHGWQQQQPQQLPEPIGRRQFGAATLRPMPPTPLANLRRAAAEFRQQQQQHGNGAIQADNHHHHHHRQQQQPQLLLQLDRGSHHHQKGPITRQRAGGSRKQLVLAGESRSPSPLLLGQANPIQQQQQQRQLRLRRFASEEDETNGVESEPQPQRLKATTTTTLHTNTLRAGGGGATFALLSAEQLDRLSRKLLDAASNERSTAGAGNKSASGNQQQPHKGNSNNRYGSSGSGSNRLAAQANRSRAPPPPREAAIAERQSAGSSSAPDDSDSDSNSNNENSGDGGGRSRHLAARDGGGGAASRLLGVSRSNLRQSEESYVIEQTKGLAMAERNNNNNSSDHNSCIQATDLSSGGGAAKNKLLLGEYFYA